MGQEGKMANKGKLLVSLHLWEILGNDITAANPVLFLSILMIFINPSIQQIFLKATRVRHFSRGGYMSEKKTHNKTYVLT